MRSAIVTEVRELVIRVSVRRRCSVWRFRRRFELQRLGRGDRLLPTLWFVQVILRFALCVGDIALSLKFDDSRRRWQRRQPPLVAGPVVSPDDELLQLLLLFFFFSLRRVDSSATGGATSPAGSDAQLQLAFNRRWSNFPFFEGRFGVISRRQHVEPWLEINHSRLRIQKFLSFAMGFFWLRISLSAGRKIGRRLSRRLFRRCPFSGHARGTFPGLPSWPLCRMNGFCLIQLILRFTIQDNGLLSLGPSRFRGQAFCLRSLPSHPRPHSKNGWTMFRSRLIGKGVV